MGTCAYFKCFFKPAAFRSGLVLLLAISAFSLRIRLQARHSIRFFSPSSFLLYPAALDVPLTFARAVRLRSHAQIWSRCRRSTTNTRRVPIPMACGMVTTGIDSRPQLDLRHVQMPLSNLSNLLAKFRL